MTEWKLVSSGSKVFKCEKCGRESRIRSSTVRKLCKGCGCIWSKIED